MNLALGLTDGPIVWAPTSRYSTYLGTPPDDGNISTCGLAAALEHFHVGVTTGTAALLCHWERGGVEEVSSWEAGPENTRHSFSSSMYAAGVCVCSST
jgi:hypothetical protein